MSPGSKLGEMRTTERGERFVWSAYLDATADKLMAGWLWVPRA